MTTENTADQPAEEQPQETPGHNLIVHSPKFLWDLGAFEIRFHINNLVEVPDIIGDCQQMFADIQETFADRLKDVEAMENQITPAQLRKLEELADEQGTDLPRNVDELSKTDASKLIDKMMAESGGSRRQSRGRSRGNSGGYNRNNYSSSRSGGYNRGGGGGYSRGNNGRNRNDPNRGITPGQQRFIADLCDERGMDIPEDLDQWVFADADAYIQELTGRR